MGKRSDLNWDWHCDPAIRRTMHEGDILHHIADGVDVYDSRLQSSSTHHQLAQRLPDALLTKTIWREDLTRTDKR